MAKQIEKWPDNPKEAEKHHKDVFWRQQHRGQYTTKDILSLDELKEQGIEIGDNGEFVNQLNSKIEVDLFLKRLTPRQKEIVELKIAGFNQKEIAIKLRLSYRTIKGEIALIRKIYTQNSV